MSASRYRPPGLVECIHLHSQNMLIFSRFYWTGAIPQPDEAVLILVAGTSRRPPIWSSTRPSPSVVSSILLLAPAERSPTKYLEGSRQSNTGTDVAVTTQR